jgi:hypothetical protein
MDNDQVATTEGVLARIWAARTQTHPRQAAWWSAAAVYAWVAGGFASFTVESEVAVVLASLVMFGMVIFAPPERKPAPRRVALVGWVAWLVPILTFSGLEIVNNFVFGSTPAHPTWSNLMDPVLEWHPARTTAVLLWLAAGRELIRR